MTKKEEIKSVEIFAGQYWEALIVKSLLANAEIEAFLKDEILGTMVPWNVSPGGSAPVKVVISSENYEMAKEVVAEFQKSNK